MSRVTIDIAPEPGDIFTAAAVGNLLGKRLAFDGHPAQVVDATMSPDTEGYIRLTVEVDGPVPMEVVPTDAKRVYGGGHE